MNADVKRKWLDALRGGEYKQTTGRLLSVSTSGEKSYCCLGVLCDIAVQEGVTDWGSSSFGAQSIVAMSAKGETFLESAGLPPSLQEWSGVYGDCASFDRPVEGIVEGEDGPEAQFFGNLVGLNDEAGWTFAQIADLIEERF